MTTPSVPRASGLVQRGVQAHASDVAHIRSMTNQVIKLYGLVDIEGIGEALVDVTFPVLFLEIPTYSRGWMLREGEVIELGSYPTCEIFVHSLTWDEDENQLRYYTGAKLGIVATGLQRQQIVGHYQFEGRAIVPPVTTDTLAEDTV